MFLAEKYLFAQRDEFVVWENKTQFVSERERIEFNKRKNILHSFKFRKLKQRTNWVSKVFDYEKTKRK